LSSRRRFAHAPLDETHQPVEHPVGQWPAQERLRDLDGKAGQIAATAAYLRKKVEWLRAGCVGPEPPLAPGICGEEPDAIYTCSIDLSETQESGLCARNIFFSRTLLHSWVALKAPAL
jgi:hypothetical protein